MHRQRRRVVTVYPEDWGWRPTLPLKKRVFSMRWLVAVCGAVAIGSGAAAVLAQTAQPTAAEKKSATVLTLPPSPKALLPDEFDGWTAAEPSKILTDPAQVDAPNAAALKEYGFNAAVLAGYKREDETLALRALRFNDVSGAYGAYSYYRQNGWPKAEIGDGAASNKNRVIFWAGTMVVDANFSRVGPMSAGELREIARQLPRAGGIKALIPPILYDLPKTNLEPQTLHYAVGPASYAGAGGVLPPSLVDFDKGAEAVTASYSLASGPATLTIVDYPTPQIAHAQVDLIRAYLKVGNKAQPPWPKPLNDSDVASLEVRDSGPLVVIVSGDAIPDESHRLLEAVHYEADLTSIPQPVESEIAKTGRLLMGISVLSLIGVGAAILLGGFFGGGRALYRMATGKPASSIFDVEFIHLGLREDPEEKNRTSHGQHPKG